MQISGRLFGNIYNIFKDMNILTEIQTVGKVANTCNPNKSKIPIFEANLDYIGSSTPVKRFHLKKETKQNTKNI